MGHLIEAGVSHFEATGRTEMLDIARKAADRVVADFRGKGPDWTPGHEEIEIALLRLHEITLETHFTWSWRACLSSSADSAGSVFPCCARICRWVNAIVMCRCKSRHTWQHIRDTTIPVTAWQPGKETLNITALVCQP